MRAEKERKEEEEARKAAAKKSSAGEQQSKGEGGTGRDDTPLPQPGTEPHLSRHIQRSGGSRTALCCGVV